MADLLDRAECPGANKYIDTRGAGGAPIDFTQAVVRGLAPGGGLFVPQEVPAFSLERICGMADMPYWQRAAEVYKAFNIDLPDSQIDALMQKTYADNFDTAEVCPVHSLDSRTHLLELWHGPTSAFKDMALQCLPNFFSASATKLRGSGHISGDFCILVATSGDTGKAALEGFKGVPGVKVGVLYPDGGVSDIQRAQMVTTTGDNVCVWAVRGNFDNCQSAVKQIFADADFAADIKAANNTALSSANSINWGRLLPQVVYYMSAYACLVRSGKIAAGDQIDVCVPTGNFGNILAAWYAREMGTPIARLICASNKNCVLTDFLTTGTYDITDRPFVLTPSPSMDILVSSNLERQLFELSGRDGALIAAFMRDLQTKRCFTIPNDLLAKIKSVFSAYATSNDECLNTIKDVLKIHDYLLDPHTAVAYAAAKSHAQNRPMLIAATAHWAKFGINVYKALHDIPAEDALPQDVAKLSGCELNRLIARETGQTHIPKNLDALDKMPVRFTDVVDPDVPAIEHAVKSFL